MCVCVCVCTEAWVYSKPRFSQFESFVCNSTKHFLLLTPHYTPRISIHKHPFKPYKSNTVSDMFDDEVTWSSDRQFSKPQGPF